MNKEINKEPEQFSVSFFGIKFNCKNPGNKSIIILVILLIFFVVLVVLLKSSIIPSMAALGVTKVLHSIHKKVIVLVNFIKGRAP